MRLGGAPGGGDPLAMGTGNDYAELCDLGPSRYTSSRGTYQQPQNSLYHHGNSASTTHIRSNSFEAEDVIGPYGSTRIGNSTSSLRGRSGLYYSPPGTSYTIVERERPHSPHYYYNTAGAPTKGGSLSARSNYLESSSISGGGIAGGAGSAGGGGTSGIAPITSSARHNGKKRPISPEQVLRLFNTTSSSSSSVPTNYHSNGTRERNRRSPASSPPSTTHQVRFSN